MTHIDAIAVADDSRARLARLSDLAQRMLEGARAAGASQAEVNCNEDTGLAVNVRMGEVETVEATRDRGVSITVYFGQRKGSASSADLREESLSATLAQACAIARYAEDDPCGGLADAALMARSLREFDSWHPAPFDADRAIDVALACEAAGREVDPRIGNSDGASMNANASLSVYANSHGFLGSERSTEMRSGVTNCSWRMPNSSRNTCQRGSSTVRRSSWSAENISPRSELSAECGRAATRAIRRMSSGSLARICARLTRLRSSSASWTS